MARRIVLTNDDGIDAPGLAALFGALEGRGERIVVAPCVERSGCGHTVTTDAPIPVRAAREGWFAVDGTPVDCARLALTHLAPGAMWLLSGINRGGNLGADVYISGTVAAAREGAFLGCRAVALSQYTRPEVPLDWEWTGRQCARVLKLLDGRPLEGGFWNLNLPAVPASAGDPEIVFCGLDPSPHDVRYRLDAGENGGPAHPRYAGNYHVRPRRPGLDVDVCFGGRIAVTEIALGGR